MKNLNKSLITLSILLSLNAFASDIQTTNIKSNTITMHKSFKKPVLPDVLNPRFDVELEKKEFRRKGPTIQVAILLDTSGSMNGLIDQARLKIWDIINEISKANKDNKGIQLEVALYEYGTSYGNEHTGFVRLLNPLTNDLDLLSENLFNLRTSGSQEYSGFAIKSSVNDLIWSNHKEDLKLIILAGNEEMRQGHVPYEYAIDKAKKQDIIVNTIFCGDKHDGIDLEWGKAAKLAGGKYLNINQNNKVIQMPTPYDDSINDLGNRLNETYLKYGKMGDMKKSRQIQQDSLASNESSSFMAARNAVKASDNYETSDWDLVGKYENDKESAIKLAKETSSQYKNLSNEEIEKVLSEKINERKEIKSKINDLQQKRSEYIKVNTKVEKDDFGTALLKVVREQAESKNFNF